MHRFLLSLLLFIFLVLPTAYRLPLTSPTLAVSYPQPTGYVNDFAQIYSEQFRQSLEQDLSDFEKQTTVEISVATIATLEGEPIEDYAVELFDRWNIGQQGKDNGLLLLIAKEDREMRIEVGYGLEPTIPDGFAGEVIRAKIIPAFGDANYEVGTQEAVDTLQARILGEEVMFPPAPEVGKPAPDIPILPLLFFGYFLLTYLASYLGRTKEIWPGAAIGGILGAVGGFFLAAAIGVILGAVFFGLFGLLLDFLLSRNFQYRKSHGLPTTFWGSGGGFSSGRGFGGGFGGFGGGRSGGGGASGRW